MSEEFELSNTREPVCPYCWHVERNAWEINFGGMEGDVIHSCGSCSEDYKIYREVDVRYTSMACDPPNT